MPEHTTQKIARTFAAHIEATGDVARAAELTAQDVRDAGARAGWDTATQNQAAHAALRYMAALTFDAWKAHA